MCVLHTYQIEVIIGPFILLITGLFGKWQDYRRVFIYCDGNLKYMLERNSET